MYRDILLIMSGRKRLLTLKSAKTFSIGKDKLGVEELRKVVQSLSEVSKCASCLDILKPDTVVCLNGHVICNNCKCGQSTCPACREDFSKDQKLSAFIRDVLAVIPHTCRYKKCKHILKESDDHEKYCSLRPTPCKFPCNWEGSCGELGTHLRHQHQNSFSLGSEEVCLFNRDLHESWSWVHFTGGYTHNLWVVIINDPNAGVTLFKCYPVLYDKLYNGDLQMKIYFKSEKKKYTFEVNLNTDPDNEKAEEENCVYVPTTIIRHFWDKEKKELRFKIE